MLWVLALDTATPVTALALGRVHFDRVDSEGGADELVAHASHDDGGRHSASLLTPRIAALLASAGVSPRELGAIACGVGPGAFTGARVALATAKGAAFGVPCPLFAVGTLAAVAGGAAHDGPVLALLDARRGEVYAARFELGPAGPRRVGPDRCCPIDQVFSDMSEAPGLQVVGPGAAVHAEALAGRADVQPGPGVDGRGLWRAAALAVLAGPPADLADLDAVYLRASYAELSTNKPRRPPHRSPFA